VALVSPLPRPTALQQDGRLFEKGYTDYLDVGKILAGIQVPSGAEDAFDAFLEELGYPFVEETLNPAYKNFLCS
jgi:hypothetical protein